MFVRVLIYECRASYCKPFCACWQGHRTNYVGTATFGSFNDPLRGLVKNTMIIRFEANADFLIDLLDDQELPEGC